MRTENIVAANKRRKKHGMHTTRVYNIWRSMKDRCTNPNSPSFPRYGGRGVAVCQRWQSFTAFYADMGDPPVGMSIDRTDVNGNYEPTNCRWATAKQQSNNTRTNTKVTYNGKTQTLAQWARELDLPYHRVVWRHKKGMTPPELFTTDSLQGKTVKHMVEYQGETMTLKEASRRSGVAMQTLYWRLRVGVALF